MTALIAFAGIFICLLVIIATSAYDIWDDNRRRRAAIDRRLAKH